MGEEAKQIFADQNLKARNALKAQNDDSSWENNMESCEDICLSISIETSTENSGNSITSSSSSDLVEDASSSSFSSSSSSVLTNGPLYELSELMVHLPLRRGLSKFYQGKSQSYTSLASVKSLEDLAKRAVPMRKKMKPCKSYGEGLDGNRSLLYNPKATISKKSTRGSFLLFSNLGGSRPNSSLSLQKNF